MCSHLVLLQHHEVEMFDPLSRILSHTFHEGRMTNHVADIFVYKGVPV